MKTIQKDRLGRVICPGQYLLIAWDTGELVAGRVLAVDQKYTPTLPDCELFSIPDIPLVKVALVQDRINVCQFQVEPDSFVITEADQIPLEERRWLDALEGMVEYE